MLAQLPEHTRESFRRNPQLGRYQALAGVKRDTKTHAIRCGDCMMQQPLLNLCGIWLLPLE